MSEDLRTGRADEPRDLQLAGYYREAAREEPPVRLDAAILAAARREVGAGPRPIASRWLRSWRLPMSIAAAVVLSVSLVTLMLEKGQDRFSVPMPDGAAGTAPPSARAPAPKAAKQPPAAEESREPTPLLRSERPTAEMRAAPPASPMRKSTLLREFEDQPPEKWLDKILELRRDGRDREADELLAEFRKRFPEHPLPPALR
jgi:hypothetical protein